MSDILDMDKCDTQFNFRIPEILKNSVEKLAREQKRAMIEQMILIMARAVHDASFDPGRYLKSGNDNGQF